MSKLRKLLPLFLAVALTLAVAVPVLAQALPPAVYVCTVYEDGALVGAGKTVAAIVGTTTVGSAMTNANGIAVISFGVTEDLLGDPLSFTVDGNACTETPDVNVSIEGLQVRLDYGVDGVYYTLTVTISPTGKGTVTRSPDMAQYLAGTTVTLTANPTVSGWVFDRWTGDASGTNPTTTVTMNSNKSVTAHFEEEFKPVEGTFKSWLYETFVECLID